MGIGSLIPLGLLTVLGTLLPESLRSVVFIGSILPGLAAYNYSRIKPGYRKWDVTTTIVLYTVLVGIGWVLVSEPFAPYLANSTPPVLYSPTADIAVIKGVAVTTELEPTILQRPVAVLVFGFGVLLSERTRTRYGVRTGMMAMALLAVYALASLWLIGLYFLVIVIAYLGLRVVHHVTLLYGRVLIAVATVTALLAIVPATLALPISRGLSAYFVAILAGVNAYSWHVTAPTKRDLFVPLQVGSFLSILVVMEVISLVRPDLIPQVYELPVIVGAALVTVVCLVYVESRATLLPDEERVFESSILSGGGEA